MAGVAIDQSITTGHATAPPTRINKTQDLVYIDGVEALVEGDAIDPHAYHDDSPHNGVVVATTNTVYIEGKKVAQVGDRISCGDTIAQGSSIVFLE